MPSPAAPLTSRWNPRLTRRQVLRAALAGSAIAALPAWPRIARAFAATQPIGFLDAGERALVEAVTARIFPSEGTIGARETGVVDYVQALLTSYPSIDVNGDAVRSAADLTAIASLEQSIPGDLDGDGRVGGSDLELATTALFAGKPIHGGGPFSGRNPFADPATGTASANFPRPAYEDFLALPRLKRLAWQVRLDGAAAVPEVADNPLATSMVDTDMRRKYRDGLPRFDAASRTRFGRTFVELSESEQDVVLEQVRTDAPQLIRLLTEHTFEGMFCAPEYGGNRERLGWQLIGFDGDSQPLGYTIYDETMSVYRERADKPNSRPDPGEPCAGFSAELTEFLGLIAGAQGGGEFPEPFCFDVE